MKIWLARSVVGSPRCGVKVGELYLLDLVASRRFALPAGALLEE